jgi:hypothetical protein
VSGRRVLAALAVCGLLAAGRSGAAATPEQPPGGTARTEASIRAVPAPQPVRTGKLSGDVATTYAQRERAAKNLERFEGGGAGVYIGGSTLVVVLLIVLIIVII